jgi:GxxExxY protein
MNDELTERLIGAAFEVHNVLRFGFLESVYENALSIELSKAGISHSTQAPIRVDYDGHNVGEFAADVVVEDRLILELKSVVQLATAHEVQLVHYLTATSLDIGLLINFGPERVEIRRKFRNYRPN